MIGVETPSFAARRTTAPCNASTSIRFPCCRSISVGLENYKALVEKHQQPMLLADYQRHLSHQPLKFPTHPTGKPRAGFGLRVIMR